MAFLKGLTPEQMEVRVMASNEAPEVRVKSWERDFAKHIQSEVRLERLRSQDN